MGLSVCTFLILSKYYECCNLVLVFLLSTMWAKVSATVKPVYNSHSQKDRKLVFKTNYGLMQVKRIAECSKHSAIRLTFIKLPFVIKIYVLSIFEWLFYTKFYCVFRPNRISRPTL